jgi:hypothetical protein
MERWVFENFWIFIIISMFINGAMLFNRASKADPELQRGSRQIAYWLLFGTYIPWMFLIIGMVTGEVKDIFELFQPNKMNPYTPLWHASVVTMSALLFYWAFFRDGIEYLYRYRGMFTQKSLLWGNNEINKWMFKFYCGALMPVTFVFELLLWSGVIGK